MTTLGIIASWAAALFGAWAFVAGLVGSPTEPAAAPPATAPRGGPAPGPDSPPAVARSARRALIASALFAALAAAVLLQLLLAGDFTVNYVARTVASNVEGGRRVAALYQLAAGAVLPAAALVALAGALVTRHAPSTLGASVTGSVVMALMAASLAAQPFATLPWVPTDGLGLSPALHQSLSLVGHLALSLAIAAAAATAACSADRLAGGAGWRRSAVDDEDAQRRVSLSPVIAMAATAVAMWGQAGGAFLAGVTATPAPPAAGNGALVAAIVAVACSWRAQRAGAGASLASSLGAAGLLIAALLANPAGGDVPIALAAFATLSLVAAASGGLAAGGLAAGAVLVASAGGAAAMWLRPAGTGWLGGAAQGALAAAILITAVASMRDEHARSVGRVALPIAGAAGVATAWSIAGMAPLALLWGAAAGAALGAAIAMAMAARARFLAWIPALLLAGATCASLAALGEGSARSSEREVRVGTTAEVAIGGGAPIALAHQGVSRYQDGNAHVIAVALEATRHDRSLALITAERREFVDGRDESLGPQTAPPAVLALALQELRVTLEALAADEAVTLRLTAVPLARGWATAILLLVAAVAVAILGARSASSPSPDRTGSG